MSTLRGRCPACSAHTAVAVDGGYECHACGRTFPAGLVRVPRAWGVGGEAMAQAAALSLPYPETAVIEHDTLAAQTEALAASLPVRPLVVGGCCCAHLGALQGLAGRGNRVALVWLDAHGDLNTPETSVSGNTWGTPLRMALDEGIVGLEDVALVGARNLDPPEVDFIRDRGLGDDVDRAVDGADGVYVALDVDVLDPPEIECFLPEPDGLSLDDVEAVLRAAAAVPVLGAGVTGHVPATDPATITRLLAPLGL